MRRAQAISAEKEEHERAERARIDSNKAAATLKKQKTKAIKAEKALQAATRSANKEEVIAKEKAEQQAQKKKETTQKKAEKDLLARPKTPTKARKASVSQKKVVWFDDSSAKEVVPP